MRMKPLTRVARGIDSSRIRSQGHAKGFPVAEDNGAAIAVRG
jgi:hypothetical protein